MFARFIAVTFLSIAASKSFAAVKLLECQLIRQPGNPLILKATIDDQAEKTEVSESGIDRTQVFKKEMLATTMRLTQVISASRPVWRKVIDVDRTTLAVTYVSTLDGEDSVSKGSCEIKEVVDERKF